MLVLLPPSETKRPGGASPPLDLASLALPSLTPQRVATIEALVGLSADGERAARVLKVGPRLSHEVVANAALWTAPTMPAVDRYTGVLFDALGAATLPVPARRWLGRSVLVHSAPLGPVGALDPIPAYRYSAGVALPGLPPQRRLWADAVSAAIGLSAPAFVLDLRSEAYAALGPVPAGIRSAYVRVVTEGPDGAARALNHFNKHAKGELVRALAAQRPRIASREALVAWGAAAGFALREGRDGELDLVR
jgi:cytoplasmic iron level regulating protein YaaA (DUF328/UPF0246 family)